MGEGMDKRCGRTIIYGDHLERWAFQDDGDIYSKGWSQE